MPAYLLLVVAILSRLVPHPDWLNFTAVGGALLYFGARRSWREMLAPLAALMATDYFLTVFSYHYAFRWQAYVTTWAWYLAVMALAGSSCTPVPRSFAWPRALCWGRPRSLWFQITRSGRRVECIQPRWAALALATPPRFRSIATICSRQPLWRVSHSVCLF